MDIPPKKSDDDELSYEDFDDTVWVDDTELEVIDLDVLDTDIPGTEINLDALDTDIPGAEDETSPASPAPDQAAADLLDAIDRLDGDLAPVVDARETPPVPLQEPHTTPDSPAPPVAEPSETPPAPAEAAPVAAPNVEPATEPDLEVELVVEPTAEPSVEPAAPPEPVIPPEIYCVLLPLPPELASQVLELRKTGQVTTMPPPGIVLTPQFRTLDLPAVEAALAKWARAHLPFQFEIVSVLAKVASAQQYIAAWTLESEEEITEAQHALRRALSDLILPLPGATMTFTAYVPVGDQIAAPRYPHVIGQMQRDFEPFVWRTNDLQLVRQGEKQGEWEMIKSFD